MDTTSPETMNTINFTKAKLQELREAYHKAKALGMEQFEFENQPILVDYAKYLIQYLEIEFNHHDNTN